MACDTSPLRQALTRPGALRAETALALFYACCICAISASGESLERPQINLGVDVNHDGSIVRVPLNCGNLDKVQDSIDALRRGKQLDKVHVVLSEASDVPCIILMGKPDEVSDALKVVSFVLREQLIVPKYLISIQVNLRSFNQSEIRKVGVNLFPVFTDITNDFTFQNNNGDLTNYYRKNSFAATAKINDIDVINSSNVGKVMVGAEILTTNGSPAMISNIQKEPIIIRDMSYTSTTMQYMTTKLTLVPTIQSFNPDNILESEVLLNVSMKIAVSTGKVLLAGTEAPTFTVKSLQTSRVIQTDGKTNLAGSFLTDLTNSTTTYIPFLGQIPIIKYLFRKKRSDEPERVRAVHLRPVDPDRLFIKTTFGAMTRFKNSGLTSPWPARSRRADTAIWPRSSPTEA